jgi:hypothetical protein
MPRKTLPVLTYRIIRKNIEKYRKILQMDHSGVLFRKIILKKGSEKKVGRRSHLERYKRSGAEFIMPAETTHHADGLRGGSPVMTGLPSHGTGGQGGRRIPRNLRELG